MLNLFNDGVRPQATLLFMRNNEEDIFHPRMYNSEAKLSVVGADLRVWTGIG